MAMTVNSSIESARTEFLDWWSVEENRLNEGDFHRVAAKVNKSVEGLLTENMTLHFQQSECSFQFFYGVKEKEMKYIPISWKDGLILTLQTQENQKNLGLNWPIKNPNTGNYFIPKVKVNYIPPPSKTLPTEQYLDQLVNRAERYYDRDNRKILEALTPYTENIQNCCKDDRPLYYRIGKLVPNMLKEDLLGN